MATTLTLPRLRPSEPQALPFDRAVEIRSFLLERDAGGVLLYAAAEVPAAEQISRWYLNHWHEAMFADAEVDAPLFVHAAEHDEVAARLHVRGTFTRRHTLGDDLEVIPTPGHTPGATAYLWDSGEHRMLFAGDSLYLRGEEWVAAVLASSDRAAYVESLALLRELDFDVLVPWAASRGGPFHAFTDRADARRRIDAVIARLRRGDDH